MGSTVNVLLGFRLGSEFVRVKDMIRKGDPVWGPICVVAPVRSNMLNMPKSASGQIITEM